MTALADFPAREAEPEPASEELRRRTASARAAMRERGLAALLLVSPENIYYLLGLDYQGYFAFTLLLVPGSGPPVLVTRAMEGPTVRAQVPGCRHLPFHDGQDPVDVIAANVRACASAGETVGIEDSAMFFPPAVRTRLLMELDELAWTDASDIGQALREVKSPTELAHVRAAAGLSDAAMGAGIAAVHSGGDERGVAAAVYHSMIYGGSQNPGFAPLIRSTAILAHEHVTWSDRTINAEEGLFLELSACVRRYHAPLSRTVFVGSPPPEAVVAQRAALDGLHAIQEALRPGAIASDVYAAWQDAVSAVCAQGETPRHHCGYLVGIGFPPSWVGGGEVLGIRPDSDRVIRAGMTFHAMSWVQEPIGYVISDTALVTGDGCELLTTTPRGLTAVS